MDHPKPQRIRGYTLGGGGLGAGQRTAQLEFSVLEETDEVRRIYLIVPNAQFTAIGSGATEFRFASVAEIDGMWDALYARLELETKASCNKPIPNLSAGTCSQLWRNAQYESQVFSAFPPVGYGRTLAVAETFEAGDLIFEIPQVFDGIDALKAFTAPQAWTLKDSNGLTFERGSLSFVADGVTWTLNTNGATGQRLEVWTETRPNPSKFAKPVLGLTASNVAQEDGIVVKMNGPVLHVCILDRAPDSFAGTFDVHTTKDGSATCNGMSSADWTWPLQVHRYDKDQSQSSSAYRNILAPRELGYTTMGLQPAPIFWLAAGASSVRIADIDGALMFNNINAADIAAGFRVGGISLIKVPAEYQRGAVIALPETAMAPVTSLPPVFQSGPYAAYDLSGE